MLPFPGSCEYHGGAVANGDWIMKVSADCERVVGPMASVRAGISVSSPLVGPCRQPGPR